MTSKRTFAIIILTLLFSVSSLATAGETKNIQLPKPQTDGGMPLMKALQVRHSTRSFSTREIPQQTLSNLLWAAFGINRPDSDKRTAPSALNWQEIDIYVATANGLYLYQAEDHSLQLVTTEDVRAKTGTQAFVEQVPINLVYVADYSRMGTASPEKKDFYSAADTGFIGQNVYLYCASEGLATVVRASIDKPALAEAMKLRTEQKIILAQSVGYPEE